MGRISKIMCMRFANKFHTIFFIIKENEIVIDLLGFYNRRTGDMIIDSIKFLEYRKKGFYATRPVLEYVEQGWTERPDKYVPFEY